SIPATFLASIHAPGLPSLTANGAASLYSFFQGPFRPHNSVSADGRFAAFLDSANNIAPGDNNNAMDVFVHDAATCKDTLVSVNRAGTGSGNDRSDYVVISANGRYVAFDSYASNLVSGDNNNTVDVFVRDLVAGTTTLVSVNSAGTGSGNGLSE